MAYDPHDRVPGWEYQAITEEDTTAPHTMVDGWDARGLLVDRLPPGVVYAATTVRRFDKSAPALAIIPADGCAFGRGVDRLVVTDLKLINGRTLAVNVCEMGEAPPGVTLMSHNDCLRTVDRLLRCSSRAYDAAVDAYTAEHRTEPSLKIADRIRRFCAHLPPRGTVDDLGCGTGVPFARTLSEAGHGVVMVDTSPKMLERAAANAPKAHARLDDMRDFIAAVEGGVTDGVVANNSILHMPREEHAAMFAAILKALRPGGVFLYGGLDGDVEGQHIEWLGGKFYHSYYPMAKTVELLEQAGFVIEYAEREPDFGEAGVWIQAIKPAA